MGDLELIFDGALARIRFNAPARRNALNRATWRALPEACAAIAARADALAVVVDGAGGHFSAGADIAEFETVYRDAEATRDYVDSMQAALGALAVARPADDRRDRRLGGRRRARGRAACDLRFAADDAHLAAPPAKLGLVYGPIETSRLVALIGPARAKDLLFSGRRVAPAEALAIGLVDRVVPAAALKSSVEDYAAALAPLSQRSIRGAKRIVDALAAGLALDSAPLGKRSRTRRSARISARAAPPSPPSARRASPSAARRSRRREGRANALIVSAAKRRVSNDEGMGDAPEKDALVVRDAGCAGSSR